MRREDEVEEGSLRRFCLSRLVRRMRGRGKEGREERRRKGRVQ